MKGNELKPHIGIFGRRNYGKSSLVNYLTGQQVAIVSDLAGTTTDPVKKTMEIGGVGPVVWIDTAGIDDEGAVGRMRIERSLAMLAQADLALILFTDNRFEAEEVMLVETCRKRGIPFVLIYSQADRLKPDPQLLERIEKDYETSIFVLTVKNPSLREPLTARIREALPESAYVYRSLLGDVVGEGDTVVMVTPIDSSAPEGRMILPQVQVLRDLLDNHARAVVCRETELASTLAGLKEPPRLVVTDSQVYGMVSKLVPDEVFLTSFSVVLARAKGLFEQYIKGTPTIDGLKDGDRVLMLESCTHNVTCEDIGRVKLPRLLEKYTGKSLQCEAVAGLSALPEDLSSYALVIQCGGCVVTAKQLAARLAPALDAGVPVSNYGLAIAYMNGIFERSMRIFQSEN
ncbi:MAG: [Bacteroidales bacterium]|nr:[FeFe] hydrogenase H-cluster maturation GTPase HydF [Bacteroidales bacterium]